MIPLRAVSPRTSIPWVTRTMTVVLLAVFAAQLASPRIGEALIRVFGFVPARLFNPSLFGYSILEAAITLVSSIFLHGGFVHLAGNLVYLWVFGGAVEERVGHAPFALIYVAGGVAGSLMHAVLFPDSAIPSIGASGCIAAILGAFLALYPSEPIVTLIPLIVSWILVEVPGLVLLPIWFALQFANGVMAIDSARGTEEVAGVAWWAHIGGFTYGLVVGLIYRRRARAGP
ncbi:MAG TPA: rhomboid family intramembrane serine protease [Thermoanaerobaculia bacterium]|nr:rhomboid family intramembrane serine protease [Thermoanaerobaculia bacterium]